MFSQVHDTDYNVCINIYLLHSAILSMNIASNLGGKNSFPVPKEEF